MSEDASMPDKWDGNQDLDRLREFKVHVPLSTHLQLHRHRLLTGQSLSRTMEEALDAYFQKHYPEEAEPEASPGAQGSKDAGKDA